MTADADRFDVEIDGRRAAADSPVRPKAVFVGDDEGDLFEGTPDADDARGGGGDDVLRGAGGDDLLRGDAGRDELSGGFGDDVLRGGGGRDVLLGNAGADRLFGGPGADILRGHGADDLLAGGGGGDRLLGGRGEDTLSGGGGDDRLDGQAGADLLTGGGGDDRFLITELDGAIDRITDFDPASEVVDVSSLLTGSPNGSLEAFVRLSASNGGTLVEIDQDGAGEDFVPAAIIDDVAPAAIGAAQLGLDDTPLPDGAPIARNDRVTTLEDRALAIQPLANDRDPEGDPLRIVALDTTGLRGTAELNDDGSITYDPGDEFQGLAQGERAADRFDYTVEDAAGNQATATVTVTLNGRNDSPTGITADAATTDEDSRVRIDVLDNDSDPDGDPIRVSEVEQTDTLGRVSIVDGGAAVRYDPGQAFQSLAAGQEATDRFRYTVGDGEGGTASAAVEVTVTGVNDAPIARHTLDALAGGLDPFERTIPENEFTDVDDGDALTITADLPDGRPLPTWLSFDPATLTLAGDPDEGDIGTISLRFTATDAAGATAQHVVPLTINGPSLPLQLTRLSVDAGGGDTDGGSLTPSISGNGRFVAFTSAATDLIANDSNTQRDVFLRDVGGEATSRVSTDGAGDQLPAESHTGLLGLSDGFVVFQSFTRISPGDTNNFAEVFHRDLGTNALVQVNVSSAGALGSGAQAPDVSADGRLIVFSEIAGEGDNRLVPQDDNNRWDVFLRDRVSGETTRLSEDADGLSPGDGSGPISSISADGNFVAFDFRGNLLPEETGLGIGDIFVRNLATGELVRASVAADGTPGNDDSRDPSISADGRFVAFTSEASNLVDDDSNNLIDVFRTDLLTGEVVRVSVDADGDQMTGGLVETFQPVISADGRFVAFATDFAFDPEDGNGMADVYIKDLSSGEIRWLSRPLSGDDPDNFSNVPDLSDDARFVVFQSQATNLTGVADGNGAADVFFARTGLAGGTLGDDRLDGTSGDDVLRGLFGNDVLRGRQGADVMEGGPGSDQLTGGAGRDQFVYLSPDDGEDWIADFQAGRGGDVLRLADLLPRLDDGIASLALVDDGANTTVRATAGGVARDLVTLEGVSGQSLDDLVGSGNVDVA